MFRTQVGIIGAGPAGLLLSQLLYLQGIESVVLEKRSRAEVEVAIRAGVLEDNTVNLLIQAGAGERLKKEGMFNKGIIFRFNGEDHRINLFKLTNGRGFTIYGQRELVKDLMNLRLANGGKIFFNVSDVTLDDINTKNPRIIFQKDGTTHQLDCDFIAGCDGSHGICLHTIPQGIITEYTRTYPFSWFGILLKTIPWPHELIYTYHDRGFALVSSRSLIIQRIYFQCDPKDNINQWPDERIRKELQYRLTTNEGWTLPEGTITNKAIFGMRSFVAEPMQYGNLFLAGDAAHIVPPTGAKGLNLAVADIQVLAEAFESFYKTGKRKGLDNYSATVLPRIWQAQHFSWWMTSLLHCNQNSTAYDKHLQLTELEYVIKSTSKATLLAENYVGLPSTSITKKNHIS